MVRKIIWTSSALNDLKEIAHYILKDSVNYAAAFVREIKKAARSLSTLSERGPVVPETEDPNVRELFVRSYRLIYQVTPSEVQILGVIHGARNLKKNWETE